MLLLRCRRWDGAIAASTISLERSEASWSARFTNDRRWPSIRPCSEWPLPTSTPHWKRAPIEGEERCRERQVLPKADLLPLLSFNGSVFQQRPDSIVRQGQQPQSLVADLQPIATDKGSPPVPVARHKKARSSVSMASIAKIQRLQHQQPTSKKEHNMSSALKMGLAPSPSISPNATSVPASASYQAQSQVASQMTQQLDAQIAQMQNQLNGQYGTSEENTLNQISQLQALQGKLNQTPAGAGNEWAKQQQQQRQQHLQPRSYSDMGPPPSTNQYSNVGISASPSNPATPAMTTSHSFNSDHATPDWSRLNTTASSFNQYEPSTADAQYLASDNQANKIDTNFANLDFTNFNWASLDTSSVL